MSKFRLERLVEVKEQLLDNKRREMESIIAATDKVTNGINQTDGDIASNYENLSTATLSGNDFYVLKEYITYLNSKKAELINQREKLRARMNTLRSELIELLKEIKMLETLEAKELRMARKSENRKEQKKLDDLALRVDERR